MGARTKKKIIAPAVISPSVQRGSLISIKSALQGASELAIVVSNDVQNDASEYILVVPLQKRTSRLKAPFTVDIGRGEGLRVLHTARADWITRISSADVVSIERAAIPVSLLEKIDQAIIVALGI